MIHALEMYLTTLIPIRKIAQICGYSHSTLRRRLKPRYPKFYKWRQGEVLSATRRVTSKLRRGGKVRQHLKIKRPNWYTGSVSTTMNLHTYIYCLHYGLSAIPNGYCVHHIDHDKFNNDLSNLKLMSWGEHTRHHNLNPSGE